MLRIAVQSKGRLYDETMELLQESGISLGVSKRTLLVQAGNFPVEVLFLRDDDIPQSVAGGVADVGIVGENEFVERNEKADVIKRLGFSRCRLSRPLTIRVLTGSTARRLPPPTPESLRHSLMRRVSRPRLTSSPDPLRLPRA